MSAEYDDVRDARSLTNPPSGHLLTSLPPAINEPVGLTRRICSGQKHKLVRVMLQTGAESAGYNAQQQENRRKSDILHPGALRDV